MKRKLLLGIITPTFLASTLVVVACGTNLENVDVSASLTSDQAKTAVLQTWVNNILNAKFNADNEQINNVNIFDAFKGNWNNENTIYTFDNNSLPYYKYRDEAINAWNFYQVHRVQQNANVWIEFKNDLEKSGISIVDFVPRYNQILPLTGLTSSTANSFSTSDINFEGNNIFIQMYNINQTSIANEINKMILVQDYFTNQTSENIKNGTDYDSIINSTGTSTTKTILENIDLNNSNFLFIKFLLENQVTQSWDFNVTENSKNYLNQKINTITGNDGFNALFRKNNISLNKKLRKEISVKINDNLNWNIISGELPTINSIETTVNSIVNYGGFKFQNDAVDALDFDLDNLKVANQIESGFLNTDQSNNLYSINELMKNSIIKYYFNQDSIQNEKLNIALNPNISATSADKLQKEDFNLSTKNGSIFNFEITNLSQIGSTNGINITFKINLNLDSADASDLDSNAKNILKNLSFNRDLNFRVVIYTKSTNNIIDKISFINQDTAFTKNNLDLNYGGDTTINDTIFSLLDSSLITNIPIKTDATTARITYYNKIVPLFSTSSSKFSLIGTPWATANNNKGIIDKSLYYSIYLENSESIFNNLKTFYVKLGNKITINNSQTLEDAARDEGILDEE